MIFICQSPHRFSRWSILAGAAGVLALAGWMVAGLYRSEVVEPATRSLDSARLEAAQVGLLHPREIRRAAGVPLIAGASELVCSEDVTGFLFQGGDCVMATGGGLLTVPFAGGLPRLLGALGGLPANRLTALASYQGSLWLGTAGQGIVELRDRQVRCLRFGDGGLDHVTALTVSQDRLYLGTLGGGLVQFDGLQFRRVPCVLDAFDASRISALAVLPAGLAVGTPGSGVWLLRGGRQERVGPPMDRVTALASDGDQLLIGTPYGLYRVDSRLRASTELPDVHVTALALDQDGAVLAGSFEGDLHRLPARGRTGRQAGLRVERPGDAGGPARPWKRLPGSIRALLAREGRLAAATERGAYVLEAGGWRRLAQLAGLRREHVSGLALDGAGTLWVGYFEGGVDRVDPATLRVSPVPGLESCPEVNHLRWDRRQGKMCVATVRGLLEHDGAAVTRTLRERDGLIGDNVAFSLALPDGALYGCEKGLTFERAGRLESLSGFQGLPSNHVYCAAPFQGRLAVGTLGGLVLVEGTKVVKVIAATRRGLPANWVTSLAELPGGLFVGTYGGGGCLMVPDGSFQPFPSDAGRLEFNNGAVLTLDGLLLAGTLSRGLLVSATSPEPALRSRFLEAGLGHPDVTALAAGERVVYAATESGLTVIPREALPR